MVNTKSKTYPRTTACCLWCHTIRDAAGGWIGDRDIECAICHEVRPPELMVPVVLNSAADYVDALIRQVGVDLEYGNQTETDLAWLEVTIDDNGSNVQRRASVHPDVFPVLSTHRAQEDLEQARRRR